MDTEYDTEPVVAAGEPIPVLRDPVWCQAYLQGVDDTTELTSRARRISFWVGVLIGVVLTVADFKLFH